MYSLHLDKDVYHIFIRIGQIII